MVRSIMRWVTIIPCRARKAITSPVSNCSVGIGTTLITDPVGMLGVILPEIIVKNCWVRLREKSPRPTRSSATVRRLETVDLVRDGREGINTDKPRGCIVTLSTVKNCCLGEGRMRLSNDVCIFNNSATKRRCALPAQRSNFYFSLRWGRGRYLLPAENSVELNTISCISAARIERYSHGALRLVCAKSTP